MAKEEVNTEKETCCCAPEAKEPAPQKEERRCCCCERTTERSAEEYQKLINRLSRIEGQVRGIKAMVQRNAYCPDILVQSAAVTAAMNSFNRELLASHIKHCVVRDIRQGNDDTIDELVATMEKLMR